ncbi:MAG: 4Fe-4S binding protein [Actinobacteria bacterium]|nr:4Fe-4S binding protein [Actinomycetota bacterium]
MKVKPPLQYVIQHKIPLFDVKVPMKDRGTVGRMLFTLGDWYLFFMSRFPVIRNHPWFSQKKNDIRFIPMYKDIELPGDAPLPVDLLYRFIDEASHRVILTEGCACRHACGCENYPREIGCLFLGDDAMEISPEIGREVGVEEAREHVKWATGTGLVPICGKVRQDNTVLAVKDKGKLLSICFCCECCCISRGVQYMKLDDMEGIFHRLDGISVEVTDDCVGCGKCVDVCYVNAMSMPYGKAQIGDYCRACGRCATVCPKDAIKIRIEDPAFLDKAYEMIGAHINHT